jgi:O-succinylhomoserine sulfhydrylase
MIAAWAGPMPAGRCNEAPFMNAPVRPAAAPALRPETRLVHAGTLRSEFGETSESLFLTQGFVYPDAETCAARFEGTDPGFIYARFSNPTVAMFEARMAALEGAEAARATASGMAAVTAALMGLVKAGDHVVAAAKLFGSCRYVVEELLPRFGVATTLVDGADLSAWRAALRPQTKALFLESPTNPTLDVYDIAAIAEVAKEADAKLVVDNVFATPLFQSPLTLGADVVVYSATKHVDGQGRCLGGVILASEKTIADHYHTLLRQTGPALSPFNAWVLLKGLETLAVRVERQARTAAALADALAGRRNVARVLYPFRDDHPQAALARRQMRAGGTLFGLEVEGGRAAAFRVMNALELVGISNNLGDAKSLVTHPATTTHQRFSAEARAAMGIGEGYLRFSAGLEHEADLLADIDAALGRA